MKYLTQMQFEGQFGLERETLRVDYSGRLAQTLHPFTDAHFARDFCENQLELVTPVCGSISQLLETLRQMDSAARKTLAENHESLWLYSNPPHIDSEAEIPVAQFEGNLTEKFTYRKKLEQRYGKRLMLYSGIHFNFSFGKNFLQELYKAALSKESFAVFRDQFYFRLFKQISRYSWLLVLLTAASPLYDASLDGDGKNGLCRSGYGSMRSGDKGYWNSFVPELDYTSLSAYIGSVQWYIQKGMLFSASELYLPVRLKPRGENRLETLLETGADHIELRMFDLNPLESLGIAQTDLEFAHLLLIYLSQQEDFDFTPQLQGEAIVNHQAAAQFDIDRIQIDGIPAKTAAANVLTDMRNAFSEIPHAQRVISYEAEKLQGHRICETVQQQITDTKQYNKAFFTKIK